MNWKLTLGVLGGYLLISHLRKRGAVTINKEDPAGKVLDQMADQGDKLAEAAGQVKEAVAAKIDDAPAAAPVASAAPATVPGVAVELDPAALSTLF